jgi:hypothetical protein
MLYEPKQDTNKQEEIGEITNKKEETNLLMKMNKSKLLSWFRKK